MLVLKYHATIAGAPSQYGDAIDWLEDASGERLQPFPKARPGYADAEAPLSNALDAWLTKRGGGSNPVVILVHGYQFDPGQVTGQGTTPDSPLQTVYCRPPAVDYHQSWLPLVGECDQSGEDQTENAIGFCYKSEAAFAEFTGAGWVNGYQYAAFDQSLLAARALATIIVSMSDKVEKLRILAHSLGTRTTSQAIRIARARMTRSLDRIVMLDGAEFSVDAAANFVNCDCDVFNITNRTDKVLQAGGGQACHPMRFVGTPGACTIGYDGLGGNARCLDLQLDNPDLAHWFASGLAPDGIPYRINAKAEEESHPFAGLDHWACYTNEGNRALVRDLVLSDLMTVARMKAHGIPDGTHSPMYGSFNGQPIPPTPQSRLERQGLLAAHNSPAGGA